MAISTRNGLPGDDQSHWRAPKQPARLRLIEFNCRAAPCAPRGTSMSAVDVCYRRQRAGLTLEKLKTWPEQTCHNLVGPADAAINVVAPAPGGVPPSPRQKPSGALIFLDRPARSCSQNIIKRIAGLGSARPALSHTHASLANHSCSRPQTGHCTREKNTGARWNSAVSISMPVGIARPVCGHRIMITPIPEPPLCVGPGRT